MNRSRALRKILLGVAAAALVAVAAFLWFGGRPAVSFEDLSASQRADFRAHLRQATEQILIGQWEGAEADLRRCLSLFEGDPVVHATLGKLYVSRRRQSILRPLTEDEEDDLVDRARAAMDRALALDPAHLPALRSRYQLRRDPRLRRYDPESALVDGQEILRLAPENILFRRELIGWLIGLTRFRRSREGGVSFDSSIGLEVAEQQIERMIASVAVGTEAHYQALHALGQVHLYMGDFDRAAAVFAQVAGFPLPGSFQAENLSMLGLSFYRGGRYEEALEALQRSIDVQPTLETGWLIRLAYLKLGRDVQDLPSEYRFPMAGPETVGRSDIRFVEIGESMGVAKVDGAGPSAFVDYDNDGDPDIIAAGCDTFTALFRNEGGRFRDLTIEAGLTDLESGFSTNMVDYDNDGHLDLYISRNGWSGPARNILLRSRGDGTFEDRSAASGLDDPGDGFVSLWSDFDRDGFLDVFIANGVLYDGSTNRLYRNRGDGTFEDATEKAGLAESRTWGTIGAAVGDYDRDGDPDIFVNGREEVPNRLYRNRGDGTFDEVAQESGVTSPRHNGYVAFFLDYNNDAYPDLLSTNLALWHLVLEGFGRRKIPSSADEMEIDVPRLYRNNQDGTFTDVTFEAGLIYPHGIMGANVADLDNDGHIDLYFGTGDQTFQRLEPSAFYRNNGDGTFKDLSEPSGLDHLGKGHGFTFADFDLDGDLDIYAPQGGFYHGDLWANPFYRNESGKGNHWIHLKLRGRKSNRFAVGAQVICKSGEMTQYREVEGGSGFGSTSSYPVEFGLGEIASVDRVEIVWPSGHRQTLRSPPVDAMLKVEEFADGWEVIHRGQGR